MKKKYRDIVVDGKEYAWKVDFHGITIWYDKEIIYCDMKYYTKMVTPKEIENIIKSL